MKLGEYELNRIYNEDCYTAIKKIPDKSIDLIYTDPPYLMDSNFGERINKKGFITNETCESVKKISKGIDISILEEFIRVMKYIYIYIWCNDKQIIEYMNFFVNKYNCDYKILVWSKDNPMPMYSKRYLDDCEYCLMFTEKNNPKFKGEDSYNNSFKVYKESINIKDKFLYNHPTIKPLNCVINHLQKSTSINDVILDCFMGSGTTAVACKELGRNFIGFEIDPKYYQIACDRLNGLTKEDREKRELGQMSLF